MGGTKLHFSVQRRRKKNEQHRRIANGLQVCIPVKHVVHLPSLSVASLSVSLDEQIVDMNVLCTRLRSFAPPTSWIIDTTRTPIIVCKLQRYGQSPIRVSVLMTLSIMEQLDWEISFVHSMLIPQNCPLLEEFPVTILNVSCLNDIFTLIDSSNVCVGNSDIDLLEMWQERSLTLHRCNGNK